ncbi:ependymin-like [Astyanax mexicanus]|uniref:Ependymin-like n=1 Tax=Astyanax mexicanus TaxID=7994 RepID=A0A8B9JLN6_ASTMX|nr:ependymin-like [Astyanax mexicanus]
MRTLLLLTVGLSVLLGALAQQPHPCKAPPYLEGKLFVLFPEGHTTLFEQFAYDAVEERIRVVASIKHDSQEMIEDRLLFFRERFYYEIHYHNKSCVKTPFDAQFNPIQIPHDAHHQAQFVLGSLSAPAEGLLVNSWVGYIPETKANYSMTFTEFGCIPITILTTDEKKDHFFSSFFDLVVGLENPDVFIPPSFCTSAKVVERKDGKVADFFSALR